MTAVRARRARDITARDRGRLRIQIPYWTLLSLDSIAQPAGGRRNR